MNLKEAKEIVNNGERINGPSLFRAQGFLAGYEAGYAAHEQKAKGLVEALEKSNKVLALYEREITYADNAKHQRLGNEAVLKSYPSDGEERAS